MPVMPLMRARRFQGVQRDGENDRADADDAYPGLYAWLHERILALPEIRPGTAVLDLGCGTGAWLAYLAEHGFSDLTGVDHGSEHRFAGAGSIGSSRRISTLRNW